jgi:hypothetical protein
MSMFEVQTVYFLFANVICQCSIPSTNSHISDRRTGLRNGWMQHALSSESSGLRTTNLAMIQNRIRLHSPQFRLWCVSFVAMIINHCIQSKETGPYSWWFFWWTGRLRHWYNHRRTRRVFEHANYLHQRPRPLDMVVCDWWIKPSRSYGNWLLVCSW